jgi:type II secretory pathway component GspD/PulD (secretin)
MKFYFTGNSLTCLKGFSLKLLLTMKLTVLLLLAVCIQVSAKVEAQTITYNKKNVSLEKALNEITKQTGYQVLYNSYLVGQAGKISLHLDHTPLRQALDAMFDN